MVLSFPGAVHQGFNLGVNINEAWNFAEEDSFPYSGLIFPKFISKFQSGMHQSALAGNRST